jgi:hypothetical protein
MRDPLVPRARRPGVCPSRDQRHRHAAAARRLRADHPKLGDSPTLARAVGAPNVPITPTFPWLGPLGLVPLPARWRIEFCEPIEVAGQDPDGADDRRVVLDLSEQVRETIQEKLYENLVKRRSAFL